MRSRNIQTTRMQNFKTISLFLPVQWPKYQVKVMTSHFLKCIFAFLIVVHKNKRHFWNPEANLHKTGMFL